MQIKTTMTYHFVPISIAVTIKNNNKVRKVGKDVGKWDPCALVRM